MKKIKLILKNKISPIFKIFLHHFKMGNVSDSAIVFAYYALLSLFPVLIIIGGVIKILNANPDTVFGYVRPLMPNSIYLSLKPIFESAFAGGHGGSNLSVGLILVIWSASSAMAAFQRAVNRTYGVDNQSALMNRIISFLWMLLLVSFLFILMLLLGFGQALLSFIQHTFNVSSVIITTLENARLPLILSLSFLVLLMLYYFVPSLKTRFKYTLFGSIFSLVGLAILAQVFSLIIANFFRNISAYKTLGTFIVVMLWLYFMGMVLLFGAVINASVHDYCLDGIDESHSKLKSLEKKALKKRL
ncbi:ribonuclease BN [Fructilactobacillus lindneri]|nr:YihY/virulence factor BrkB family protein [Fructilactobacillus lindneri]POH06613.1 ribonuclease BN [Fructilactobacillus lindneri]POH06790.1 ribonuclease BN [Fructilactobacillus lindneri]POH24154.1 ribonuclease BN [Fructilactobacillus lindneri DSM 20690 = JCM 11027]SJZ91955.1 membrane protein [Fructilactobacillus lindneri DSM 20690 = JCM 11027]